MKYIYFDVSSGFSPVMALGALLDMFKEESCVNELLCPFASSVFTETVSRGGFDACLAHIDLCEESGSLLESCINEALKNTADEFQKLSPSSDLREVLEAVSVCRLLESFGINTVCYGVPGAVSDFESDGEDMPEDGSQSCISPAGYALLKLLKAESGLPQNGDISLVGYGADSIEKNPDGILRAMMYEENRNGLFAQGMVFESLFAEETAIL